ncbi:MAG: hypothetical protein K2Y14_09145 [Burkholderiales bacterium]|jgi:hypothetical protein|nr:hypothetical protein [Burkholderiales bacterium]
MKNKLLLVIVAALIAGCADKAEYDKALKDPITLNLVKQSSLDQGQCNGYISPYKFINGCNLVERSICGGSVPLLLLFNFSQKPITCDALDLRLKNQNYYARADDLVNYYLQKDYEEKSEFDSTARQTLIQNMANGK